MKDIKEVVRQLEEVDWDFAGFIPGTRGISIHGLHWYPAPFPPALVGSLIDILGKNGKTFLDPFSGSGVGPIEAWSRGMHAFGIDGNRYVVGIARAKVDLVTKGTKRLGEELAECYRLFHRRAAPGWQGVEPELVCSRARFKSDIIRWFVPSVLREIAILKCWINSDLGDLEGWRNVLVATASSLLHGQYSVVKDYHYTYVVDRSKVKKECREEVDVSTLFIDRLIGNFTDGELIREQLSRSCSVLAQREMEKRRSPLV